MTRRATSRLSPNSIVGTFDTFSGCTRPKSIVDVTVFTISHDWPVFVLEDDARRINWFKQRLPQAAFATSAEDALRILATTSFRAVFLDHDLTFADAAFPNTGTTSGVRVASFLKSAGFQGIVVIHSVNERGAAEMKVHLANAHIAPFGTFDLKCD